MKTGPDGSVFSHEGEGRRDEFVDIKDKVTSLVANLCVLCVALHKTILICLHPNHECAAEEADRFGVLSFEDHGFLNHRLTVAGVGNRVICLGIDQGLDGGCQGLNRLGHCTHQIQDVLSRDVLCLLRCSLL